MPPQLALLITLAFIAYLFRRDFRAQPNVTAALWIPFFWIFIIASRPVTEWCAMIGLPLSGGWSVEEGSVPDSLVYYALIVAALWVIKERRVNLFAFIENNRFLSLFLLFGFIAILWSDFPFVSFKRWTKVIGHPMLALILLTEPNPKEALITLMKRCAYVLIPLSIVFIKYYPDWGRGFSQWTGEGYNTGVTLNKNLLGLDCMVLGLFFSWYFIQVWKSPKSKSRQQELILCLSFGYLIWWTLSRANSSTSLMSLIVGVVMLLFLGSKRVNKRYVGAYVVVGIVMLLGAEVVFDASDTLISMLGRNTTLTGRTDLWHELLAMDVNPVIGTGFESFWLGERRKVIESKFDFGPTEAHNGYLETYLDLGVVGVLLLIGLLLAIFRKINKGLIKDFELNRLRFAFLVAMVVYNWTEATFKGLSFLYFVFFVIAVDYKQGQPRDEVGGAENIVKRKVPRRELVTTAGFTGIRG